MRVRVGVVGVGDMGIRHVRVLRALRQAELVAVCDVNRARAETVAKDYGINAYDRSDVLLKEEDLDALTICVWPQFLVAEAKKALGRGVSILVEKPMASNMEKGTELVKFYEEARREGVEVIAMVGLIERFNPAVDVLRKAVEEDMVGKPILMSSYRVSYRPEWRKYDVDVIRDLAIHDLDLLRYLTNEEPTSISATTTGSWGADVDDHVVISMAFRSGLLATIGVSWRSQYKWRGALMLGTRGILRADYLDQRVVIELREDKNKVEERILLNGAGEDPLKKELEHFLTCVARGEEPIASLYDGLEALRLSELAIKSLEAGKPWRL